MTRCSECRRAAEFLVVIAGEQYIERFCPAHLRRPDSPAASYEIFPAVA